MGGRALILLDTHTLIWLDQDEAALGRKSRSLADGALSEGTLAVSVISFWEVAMLVRKRRIRLRAPTVAWRRDFLKAGLVELSLDGEIVCAAEEIDDLHNDPADRFILATAIKWQAQLVTADARLLAWPGKIGRHDARK